MKNFKEYILEDSEPPATVTRKYKGGKEMPFGIKALQSIVKDPHKRSQYLKFADNNIVSIDPFTASKLLKLGPVVDKIKNSNTLNKILKKVGAKL
jgi:hypothetical protein